MTLTGAATATPSFTAPLVSAQTTLVFRLQVCDPGPLCDTDTVAVTVKPPTIDSLIASVNLLPANVPSATKSSLLQKLNGANKDRAKGNIAGACDKLASFISEVKALRTKKNIPASAADALIAEAQAARVSLGCA